MAEPLTNVNEPGFFSQIQESPSLFLNPGSVQTVGLVGEGKSTKSVLEDATRSSTLETDTLANEISSVNAVSSSSVFRFPASSYRLAKVGTVDGTISDVDGLYFKVTVDGQTPEEYLFAAPTTTITDAATALDGAFTNVSVEVDADGKMLIYVSGSGLEGKSFIIDTATATSAAATLGFTEGDRADSLWWDAAITDPELAPQSGTYTVDYERPKAAADYAPQSFFGLRQVVAEYGDVSADNTLSLGAQAAFGNGASIVVCRQLDPEQVDLGSTQTAAEINAALADMEKEDVSILVPMQPLNAADAPVASYLNHVSKMSSRLERKERTCVLSVDETAGRLTILGSTGTWQGIMSNFDVPESSGLESKRVMVINPGRCLTSYKGTVIETDGTYLAACHAGRLASAEFDEAEPMTRKTYATVDELILPDLTRSEKNVLTGFGVTVLEAVSSVIRCRRSVTANSSSIASQEPSIVRAFDRVAQELREGLENRFVGTKILPGTTKTAIEAATNTFLDRLVKEEIIGAYRNIKAEQNAVEPRQFDVQFEAIPVFPFIWGFIDISINIS